MPAAGRRPPPPLAEPQLPGGTALFQGGGHECVGRFLRDRGWEPETIEAVQAVYRPERSLTVRFRAGARRASTGRREGFSLIVEARAEGPAASPSEAPRHPTLLAEPVAVYDPYLVWAFPYDPSLPGLPTAADGLAVRRRLSPRPGSVAVDPLRYRPRRRAVFRYRTFSSASSGDTPGPPGTGVFYAKVLPPARARSALAVAGAIRGAGPTASLHLALPVAEVARGAFLVPALPGRCLRELLLEGSALPEPQRLARLPEDLADLAGPGVGRLSPGAGTERGSRRHADPALAQQAAEVLGRLVPPLAGMALRIADAVSERAEGDPVAEGVVHGDLYESQVFVQPDQRLGLVDLDDLGPGDPALDAANFCAHLIVLAAAAKPAAGRVLSYREGLRAAFLERLGVKHRSLAWREAYAMLLLASGPFRVLQPDWPGGVAARLGQAERLLDDC